mgnify:CR=1 FL=1
MSKHFSFPGISGIYSIICSQNNKRYIGKSKSIGNRIGAHLFLLRGGSHPNKEMQKDFDEFGFASFSFSVLEFVDPENLTNRESQWIQQYSNETLYNAMPVYDRSKVRDIETFISYINSKWLAHADINPNKPNQYRIVEVGDQEEIMAMAHRCKLFDIFRSQLTFLRVMKFLESDLGYTVITGRTPMADGKRTFKIITAFDSNKIICGKPEQPRAS